MSGPGHRPAGCGLTHAPVDLLTLHAGWLSGKQPIPPASRPTDRNRGPIRGIFLDPLPAAVAGQAVAHPWPARCRSPNPIPTKLAYRRSTISLPPTMTKRSPYGRARRGIVLPSVGTADRRYSVSSTETSRPAASQPLESHGEPPFKGVFDTSPTNGVREVMDTPYPACPSRRRRRRRGSGSPGRRERSRPGGPTAGCSQRRPVALMPWPAESFEPPRTPLALPPPPASRQQPFSGQEAPGRRGTGTTPWTA